MLRIGEGIDVHAFVKGRPLILGALLIDYPFGLQGHSDADVLLHAISDALLGALALGDVGMHFPSNDNQWKDVASSQLLDMCYIMIQKQGYHLVNLDATIICQEPILSPYIQEMRYSVAKILRTSYKFISIKAKTTDYLGFIGAKKGIAAIVNVLIESEEK